MKKGLAIITLSFLLASTILPSVSFAMVRIGDITAPTSCTMRHNVRGIGDKFQTCPEPGHTASYATEAHCCLVDRVLVFIDWFFWALIIISFFMLLIGAFNILTAGGNPDKVALGRKYLMFASIGLVLALLTFVIPRMIIRVVL